MCTFFILTPHWMCKCRKSKAIDEIRIVMTIEKKTPKLHCMGNGKTDIFSMRIFHIMWCSKSSMIFMRQRKGSLVAHWLLPQQARKTYCKQWSNHGDMFFFFFPLKKEDCKNALENTLNREFWYWFLWLLFDFSLR